MDESSDEPRPHVAPIAARRLGVTQPRLNNLLRGRVQNFSLDALVDLAAKAGLSVRLDIAA